MAAFPERQTDLRNAIVEAMRQLLTLGLSQGTSGNISARWGEGLLVTPSGIPADALEPGDIVEMSLDGSYDHPLKPSSEWRFHCDILAMRPELGAVVHAHPPYATGFSICGREIPAVHYMIAFAGGPTIRCAPYAPYGTRELSAHALEALQDRTACLLANHGMIAAGADLGRAMFLAVELEALCRQYAIALQVGTPQVLSNDEIARMVERFKSYGPQAKPAA